MQLRDNYLNLMRTIPNENQNRLVKTHVNLHIIPQEKTKQTYSLVNLLQTWRIRHEILTYPYGGF